MPWSRDAATGQHVFYHLSRPAQPIVSAQSNSGADTNTVSTGSIQEGSFVQYTGVEPPSQFATQAAQKNYTPTMTVELADPKSTCVAGVVTGTNQIKTKGVVLAWVIKQKRELPLSGIYSTSVNGVSVGSTAIVRFGSSFIMARSRDDDVEKLKQQFSELTAG